MLKTFLPVQEATTNSNIVSNEYVATENCIVRILSSNGFILLDGVQQSSLSVTVFKNHRVALVTTSSSSENQSKIITYDINNAKGAWCISTIKSNFKFSFTFLDTFKLLHNSTYNTETFRLSKLTGSVYVVCPMFASIIKNGINVGTSTTANNNDTIGLRFITPVAYGENICVALAIGPVVDFFDSKTATKQDYPKILFQDTYAEINSMAVSNTVNIEIDPDVLLNITCSSVATIFINGIDRGQAFTVKNGDAVHLSTPSPSYALDASIVVCNIGNAEVYWCVIAEETPKYYFVSEINKNKLPIEVEINSGICYLQKIVGNTVTSYSANAFNAPQDKKAHFFLCNPLENKVYVMNPSGATIYYVSFNSGEKPMMVCSGPAILASPQPAKKYITLYGVGQVAVYDVVSSSIIARIDVQAGPTGIGITSDNRIYVCNTIAGTISIIDSISNKVINTLNTGGKPYDIVTDRNFAYVTNISLDCVHVLDSGNIINTIPVEGQPTGITISSGLLWITCAYTNTIQCFSLGSSTITKSYKTYSYPIASIQSGTYLYIIHYGTNYVLKINTADDSFTDIVLPQGKARGICKDVDIYVFSYESNTTLVDKKESIEIIDPSVQDMPLNKTLSLPLIITKFIRKSKIFVANTSKYSISDVNNEVVSATSNMSVSTKTSSYNYDKIRCPVVIDGIVFNNSTTTIPNVIPDNVYFKTYYGLVPDEIVDSNEVIIDGLSAGITIPITYNHGTIFINGQEGNLVKNKDKIVLRTKIPIPFNTFNAFPLSTNNYTFGIINLNTTFIEGGKKAPPDAEYQVRNDIYFNHSSTDSMNTASLSAEGIPFNWLQTTNGRESTFLSVQQTPYESIGTKIMSWVKAKAFIYSAQKLSNSVHTNIMLSRHVGLEYRANIVTFYAQETFENTSNTVSFSIFQYCIIYNYVHYNKQTKSQTKVSVGYTNIVRNKYFVPSNYKQETIYQTIVSQKFYLLPMLHTYTFNSYIKSRHNFYCMFSYGIVSFENTSYSFGRKFGFNNINYTKSMEKRWLYRSNTFLEIDVNFNKQQTVFGFSINSQAKYFASLYYKKTLPSPIYSNQVDLFIGATLVEKHLFATASEAAIDATQSGYSNYEVFQIENGWYWRTTVSGINCSIVPRIHFPVGGYIQGG